ncbi:molybdate ABC transporter permease subunit [Psychrobacter pacificensis]|uniref:molybdate ABC transporter permease subunit n=1 Tax=Psychrobacter pacificensis TaxID=112002 RepID=UPI001CBB633A|nr:molybdate ABC transporter permease subunit [Psychrobacter pacificensis]MBZ1392325.1 molybdate ABC transporter permease subunit [Psychrobacter pacificensis]MDE0843849.1 molybdate ABC transporter permease subunit [Psychrobacter pacificensis]
MIDQSLMSDMLSPFWVSIKLASITTLCLLLFATPMAYWLAKPSQKKAVGRFKILLMGVIAMPLVLPPTVIGFYLLLLLSPSMGIGKWLIEHNISPLIFTFEGLVVGSIIYSLPFYIQPVYAQFLRIPQSVTEVAHLLEPSRLRRFVKVALPQARVGIILGSLISFAHTIGEFGVVLMIGGSISGETKVVSIAIYEQVEALNYEAAHMTSGILIIMGVVMVALIASVSRMSQRP